MTSTRGIDLQRATSSTYKPIKSYAAIGNTHTAALVNLDGSIDWCCLPRFDSPSLFAAILDAQHGGSFRLSPAGEFESSQEYIPKTNVLKTTFQAETSTVELVDFMPCFKDDGGITGLPEIHRRLHCLDGSTEIRIDFHPKPNYGMSEPEINTAANQVKTTTADESLILRLSSSTQTTDKLTLTKDETIWLSLLFTTGTVHPTAWDPQPEEKLLKTIQYWRGWIKGCKYKGRWSEIVQRSALTLKLLSYSPTGTLVAAATTSLPEVVGGSRNWDYRYTWIRDSAYSLQALKRLGYHNEGKIFTRWLRSKCRRGISRLQIMFDVEGGADLPELELPHLEGYMQSRPVRIGNAASSQFQLDTYGTILDAIYFLHKEGKGVPKIEYELFVRGFANFICETYSLPDSGIWEIRNGPKHYVYSKLWCWVGLDRAIRLAKEMNHMEDARKWMSVRKLIKEEILTKGWSKRKKSFRQHYETDEPDAANLLIPLVGFLKPNHPKFKMNLEATTRELSFSGLIYRYKPEGGSGKEGTFTLCTLWLIDCLAKMGRVAEATALFEKVLEHGNHVGLYSEEIDPKTGEALGNFPQAFTHLNIINAAIALDSVMARKL